MELEEKTNPENIDLSSFENKDELNPKIWDENGKLDKRVRKNLLTIADDYFEGLDLDSADYEDITLTGSLANFNWSKFSDVDLHIVMDYNDIHEDYDLVFDYLQTKSDAWIDKHDITMYGFDVEIFVQDIDAPHFSTGVYSILNDEWVVEPKKQKISFNDESVKNKVTSIMDRVERLYDTMESTKDYDKVIKGAKKIKTKIKNMRQSGLESGGEFSVENIAFKTLRRNGTLDRLSDLKIVAYDKKLTIENHRYL